MSKLVFLLLRYFEMFSVPVYPPAAKTITLNHITLRENCGRIVTKVCPRRRRDATSVSVCASAFYNLCTPFHSIYMNRI